MPCSPLFGRHEYGGAFEHNLDVIAEADWCIDMGPEGGDAGGEVVVAGSSGVLVKSWKISQTGKALRDFLK